MENHKTKILCVGCSFTNGTPTTRDGYTKYLAGFLDDYQVINGGRGAWGIWAHQLAFEASSPDLLILQVMGPDRRPFGTEENELCDQCIRDKDMDPCMNKMIARWSNSRCRNQPTWYWDGLRWIHRGQSPAVEVRNEFDLFVQIDSQDHIDYRRKFKCPCIYLLNDWGYPYYDSYSVGKDIIEHFLDDTDMLCVTHFGEDSRISDSDGHPNNARNKETAEILSKLIKGMV